MPPWSSDERWRQGRVVSALYTGCLPAVVLGDLMLIVLLCSSMLQPLILNYTVPHAMPAIDMCGSCADHPGAIGSAGCKHGTVGRQVLVQTCGTAVRLLIC